MGYVLMWLESLGAALLLVAGLIAWSLQATRFPKVAFFSVVAAAIVSLAPPVGLIAFNIAFMNKGVSIGFTAAAALWIAGFLAGCVVLWLRSRKDVDGRKAGELWPLNRLRLAFAVALVLHAITFLNMDATMQAKLATLRMEAGAMALASAPPRLMDRDNAALLYEKAFDSIKRGDSKMPEVKKKSGDWFKNYNKPEFNAADAELRAYLQIQTGSLVLLRQAAAMPGCYFDRDYSQPSLDMQLPELSHMRGGARLLAASARCRAADGDVKGALEDVVAIRSMARHMGGEPMLISGLVSLAIGTMATDTLEGILRTRTPGAQDVAVLSKDTLSFYPRALRRCMTTEQAFGLSAFAMMSGEQDSQMLYQSLGLRGGIDLVVAPVWRVFLLPDDLQSYRRYMTQLRDASTLKFKDYKVHMERADKNPRGILTQLIAPALDRVHIGFMRAEAQQRLAEVALAIAAYRADNGGKFPASLEVLTPQYIPEIPMDPFDDQPMRYLPEGDGGTLYSIGSNLKDERAVNRDPNTGDIVFRLGNAADNIPPQPGTKPVNAATGSF